MRVEVMQHFGLTQPLSQAGYHETAHHQELLKDIKAAIPEGKLIAVCGVVGCGKTVTMRRLQQQLKDENRIIVSKSLSVEKHHIKLATLIAALFYDLAPDKLVQIPKQGERRERELRELVKKGKRPLLGACAANPPAAESILTDDAIDLLATRLRTPLQIQQHLTFALEAGYQVGVTPITTATWWNRSCLVRSTTGSQP